MGGKYPLMLLPIWVSVFFAFSPTLLRLGSGPRAYNGTPRVLGQSFYLLHLFAAYYGYVNQNMTAIAISLFAGAAIIVTTKFGTQVLFFFGFFFSAFVEWKYIILLIGVFTLSILLTSGRSLDVLEGQVRHSIFYFKYLQKAYLYPSHPALTRYLKNAWNGLSRLVRYQWRDTLKWFYTESFFIHYLITVSPQFLLLPVIWVQDIKSPIEMFLFTWAGSGLFWFFFTKLKKFLFIGEGERYLEYAMYPSTFLVVSYLLVKGLNLFLYIWLGYSILSAGFYIRRYLKEAPSDFEETEKLFKKLNELPEGVILPIGPFHWEALYRSNFPVLTYGTNMDERKMSFNEFKLLYKNFPYTPFFREVLVRYRVSYIITNQVCLDYYLNNIIENPKDFGKITEPLFETKSLIFRKVKTD